MSCCRNGRPDRGSGVVLSREQNGMPGKADQYNEAGTFLRKVSSSRILAQMPVGGECLYARIVNQTPPHDDALALLLAFGSAKTWP